MAAAMVQDLTEYLFRFLEGLLGRGLEFRVGEAVGVVAQPIGAARCMHESGRRRLGEVDAVHQGRAARRQRLGEEQALGRGGTDLGLPRPLLGDLEARFKGGHAGLVFLLRSVIPGLLMAVAAIAQAAQQLADAAASILRNLGIAPGEFAADEFEQLAIAGTNLGEFDKARGRPSS
jgi:hypothetical protein